MRRAPARSPRPAAPARREWLRRRPGRRRRTGRASPSSRRRDRRRRRRRGRRSAARRGPPPAARWAGPPSARCAGTATPRAAAGRRNRRTARRRRNWPARRVGAAEGADIDALQPPRDFRRDVEPLLRGEAAGPEHLMAPARPLREIDGGLRGRAVEPLVDRQRQREELREIGGVEGVIGGEFADRAAVVADEQRRDCRWRGRAASRRSRRAGRRSS